MYIGTTGYLTAAAQKAFLLAMCAVEAGHTKVVAMQREVPSGICQDMQAILPNTYQQPYHASAARQLSAVD